MNQHLTMLDAYLDDQLPPDERAQFERALSDDSALQSALRAAIDQQRMLDQSIRRMFAAPMVPQLPALASVAHASQNGNGHAYITHKTEPSAQRFAQPSAQQSGQPSAQGVGFWNSHISMRVAAVIAFFLLTGPLAAWQAWQAYDFSRPRVSYAKPRPLDQAYNSEVEAGFKPVANFDPVSTSGEDFNSVSKYRFGESIALQPLPPNVELVGFSFHNVISPFTVSVLLRVSNQPVVVYIESVERDPGQSLLSDDSKLHLFKRQIGNAMIYEVSPFDKPSAIGLFHKP